MNDIQVMSHISVKDLEDAGFKVDEINNDGYTCVYDGNDKAYVWFSKNNNRSECFIKFIAEISACGIFKKLYEVFPDINMMDEDDFYMYAAANGDFEELAASTKERIFRRTR